MALRGVGLLAVAALPAACATRPVEGISAYYDYDFPAAREAVRERAAEDGDDVVLDNLRLGLAALADGAPREAEIGLGRVFELLSTAGLNKDRTTASVLLYEGVRIWKGEPFEQALAYYWTSALYATLGDWANARAAAANSLFRLTDFGRDMTQEKLVRKAARSEAALERYTAVDTNFALGFLMQAVGADRSGTAGSKEQFDAALRIDPRLGGIVETLRSRAYDTLLLVDFGRGPRKVATGPDGAIAEFRPVEMIRGPLTVVVNGRKAGDFPPACDVDQLAVDHRWNNLEDVRRAKSVIGTLLLAGGAATTGIGAYNDSGAAVAIGIGAMLAGALLKASAVADTRYCEFAPAAIYVVPLQLGQPSDILMQVGAGGTTLILPGVRPGEARNPRAIYLRLFDQYGPVPPFLTAVNLLYTNDATGVRTGDQPWVLGGGDVGTPTPGRLAGYQAGGTLLGWTTSDLVGAWTGAGYVIGAGMESRPGQPVGPSWRHVLEGGTGVFTPTPWSIGYKRIMYTPSRVPAPPLAAPSGAAPQPVPSTQESPRP